mgnify:CR=1
MKAPLIIAIAQSLCDDVELLGIAMELHYLM